MDLALKADFLDLTLEIKNGHIVTKTYEKTNKPVPLHPSDFCPFSWSAQKHYFWKCPSLLVSKFQY
jgi:hypothetical protein